MAKPAWLAEAETDVGYRESPVNRTKYGRHYGLDGSPWCAMAVSRWCDKSGHPLPSMQPGMPDGYAAVFYGISYAKSHGLWIPSWQAKAGDAICYGWDGPSSPPAHQHTGLVVSSGARGSTGHTIEGNRGDAVGRFTFTVGSDVVLGCIDLNRLLLGRPKVTVSRPTVKPEPQPRNPEHPTHTGPLTKHERRRIRRFRDFLTRLLRSTR